MGTVQQDVKCNICEGVALNEFQTHSAEETTLCRRCGSYQSDVLQRDENNNLIENEEGHHLFERKEEVGYGVLVFQHKNGPGQVIFLSKPADDEEIQKAQSFIEDNDLDRDESFLASWSEGKQTLLVGKKIPDVHALSFDEYMASFENQSN